METNSGRIFYEGNGILDSIIFISSVQGDESYSSLNISPNPFIEDITFKVILLEDNSATFTISDIRGTTIFSKALGYLRKGENKITLNIGNNNTVYIAPGIYIVSLKAGKNIFTDKLIKVSE